MTWQAISNAEHHDGTGETSTSIKHALRSAKHHAQAKATPIKQTDALRIGRLTHVMVFEPENWPALACECPMEDGAPMKRNSNLRKQTWAQFYSERGERDYYTPAEYDQMCAIAAAVAADSEAARWLASGVPEVSGIVDHPQYGTLKIRPDLRCSNRRVIVDLKTCEDAGPEAAARAIRDWKYDLSAALYTDIAAYIEPGEPWRFVWIFAEKSPPYDVRCYVASETDMACGRSLYTQGLNTIKNGDGEPGTVELEQPIWYTRQVLG